MAFNETSTHRNSSKGKQLIKKSKLQEFQENIEWLEEVRKNSLSSKLQDNDKNKCDSMIRDALTRCRTLSAEITEK